MKMSIIVVTMLC